MHKFNDSKISSYSYSMYVAINDGLINLIIQNLDLHIKFAKPILRSSIANA